MTPAQRKLYFRAWSAAKKAARLDEEDRHRIHIETLGQDKSSNDLTNRDLDKILATFAALAHPDNLAAQIAVTTVGPVPSPGSPDVARAASTTTVAESRGYRKRMTYWLRENCDPNYIVAIAREKFGTAHWENLPDAQLAQLHMTLKNRPKAQAVPVARSAGCQPAVSQVANLPFININRNTEPALCGSGEDNEPF